MVQIRPARREEAGELLGMIIELAEMEKEADQVKNTVEQLQSDGWPTAEEVAAGRSPRFEVLYAEVGGAVVGFALFFQNYSTWEGLGCVP